MPSVPEALRLNNRTLSQLPASIARPTYDRGQTEPALVHIGVGGFNRSHLAVYLDDLLQLRGEKHWGEFGVGLMPGDKQISAALEQQDCLYGVLQMDAERETYRVIGSLTGHLYAPDAPESVLERMSAAECKIISLTVTEGGYFIEDASGRFDASHESIRHDLEHPETPGTWVGFVAEAANRRRKLGRGPFTLLSCDNLQHNGKAARTALLSYAALCDDALALWIERNVSFPCSMVDRITPRTTEENHAVIRKRFGVDDLSPVVCEPFRQWVLEDEFIAGRPAWERVGAQMTADVAPYEMTKMRLLNGGHSSIGYVADLLGFRTIADAARDPQLHQLLLAFMAEVRPTIPTLPGIDLDEYTATIARRFANPAIRDQVERICSDGCAKMAKFLMPSLWDLYKSGATPRVVPFVIASWLHYLRGKDEEGRAMNVSDPMLAVMSSYIDRGAGDASLALAVRAVFGDMPQAYPQFAAQVENSLASLSSLGVRAALAQLLK